MESYKTRYKSWLIILSIQYVLNEFSEYHSKLCMLIFNNNHINKCTIPGIIGIYTLCDTLKQLCHNMSK